MLKIDDMTPQQRHRSRHIMSCCCRLKVPGRSAACPGAEPAADPGQPGDAASPQEEQWSPAAPEGSELTV